MKKISTTLYTFAAFLTFSSAALASQSSYFYVAGDVGIFQADFNNTYLDQVDIIPQNIAQPATQHGYTGGVTFGYSRLFSQRYFGGAELSANVEGHNASFQSGASTSAFSDSTQIQGHADLTFVPGIMLSNSIAAYLKLGLSLAVLQDSLSSPAGYTPVTNNYNTNKNVFGFAAGLGVATPITDHVSLFTEANYHDYGTVNFQGFQNFSATYTHSSHVYSYDVVVGAAYKFDA